MAKVKVSTLEGPLLAEFVARAQEFEIFEEGEGGPIYYDKEDSFVEYVDDYRPDINGGQAMELVKKFDIDVNKLGSSNEWCARVYPGNGMETISDTPEIAICRAVIASVYGEYVDDAI